MNLRIVVMIVGMLGVSSYPCCAGSDCGSSLTIGGAAYCCQGTSISDVNGVCDCDVACQPPYFPPCDSFSGQPGQSSIVPTSEPRIFSRPISCFSDQNATITSLKLKSTDGSKFTVKTQNAAGTLQYPQGSSSSDVCFDAHVSVNSPLITDAPNFQVIVTCDNFLEPCPLDINAASDCLTPTPQPSSSASFPCCVGQCANSVVIGGTSYCCQDTTLEVRNGVCYCNVMCHPTPEPTRSMLTPMPTAMPTTMPTAITTMPTAMPTPQLPSQITNEASRAVLYWFNGLFLALITMA